MSWRYRLPSAFRRRICSCALSAKGKHKPKLERCWPRRGACGRERRAQPFLLVYLRVGLPQAVRRPQDGAMEAVVAPQSGLQRPKAVGLPDVSQSVQDTPRRDPVQIDPDRCCRPRHGARGRAVTVRRASQSFPHKVIERRSLADELQIDAADRLKTRQGVRGGLGTRGNCGKHPEEARKERSPDKRPSHRKQRRPLCEADPDPAKSVGH